MNRFIAFLCIIALYLAVFIIVAHAAPGQATLTWDNPATCTDGTAIPADAIIVNTLYQTSPGQPFDYNAPYLPNVDGPPITVPAPGRRIWQVTSTAICPDGGPCCSVEGEPSNAYETHQTGPTNKLRATNR